MGGKEGEEKNLYILVLFVIIRHFIYKKNRKYITINRYFVWLCVRKAVLLFELFMQNIYICRELSLLYNY